MKESIVVEWAPFRLNAEASEERLLTASRELQESFLAQQPGFRRRELLRGRDGEWVDLVEWEVRRSAEAAMKAAEASAICLAYFHLMAGGPDAAGGVLHFDRVASYGAQRG